jgi:hypothetical protein
MIRGKYLTGAELEWSMLWMIRGKSLTTAEMEWSMLWDGPCGLFCPGWPTEGSEQRFQSQSRQSLIQIQSYCLLPPKVERPITSAGRRWGGLMTSRG